MPERGEPSDVTRDAVDRPSAGRLLEQVELDIELIETLVALRCDRGMTQRQLAQRMGVDQALVSRLENADLDVHLSTLARYAHALGVHIVHVVRDET